MAEYGKGYGKRPLWQWVAIYVVVGGLIYGAVYYFYIAKKGGYSTGGSMYNYGSQTPTQAVAPAGSSAVQGAY